MHRQLDEILELLLEIKHYLIVKKKDVFVQPINRDPINTEQYQELMIELEDYPSIVKAIRHKYEIATLAELPKVKYRVTLKEIRRLKNLEESE